MPSPRPPSPPNRPRGRRPLLGGRGVLPATVATILTILTIVSVATVGIPRPAAAAEEGADLPIMEVLLEAGIAKPRGSLADDWGTNVGTNARDGYELGFRLRVFTSAKLAVAPTFHFAKFREFTTEEEIGGTVRRPLSVATSIVHFGLDAQYFTRARSGGLEPFVSLGAGLARNRAVVDRDEPEVEAQSVWSFTASLGAGIRYDLFELSIVYRRDRFDTIRFVREDVSRLYDWDHVILRIAWRFP